jgi:iron complex transport system substrate-binding protein
MTTTRNRLAVAAALTLAASLALAACSPTSAPESSATASSDDASGAFPVSIENKFGTTEIPEQPERIVTVGYHEQDWLYALGIAPVAVREWYGGYEYATWPWAEAARQAVGAEPEVLSNTELNFEQIAALDPDLIIATWSGITEEDYGLLSQIAPTLAQSGDWADYGMPFDEETRMIAQAVGKTEEGEQIIADLDAEFEAVRAAHPEWEGKTTAVGFLYEGQPGVYFSYDPRPQLLARLGLDPTPADALGDPETDFYVSVSPERLDSFTFESIVWLAALSPDTQSQIEGMALYPQMVATQTGGHIWSTDGVFEGAFSFASPLSQRYALDALVPSLEGAFDGDPSTPAPPIVAAN